MPANPSSRTERMHDKSIYRSRRPGVLVETSSEGAPRTARNSLTSRIPALLEQFENMLDRIRKDIEKNPHKPARTSASSRMAEIERIAQTYRKAMHLKLEGASIRKIQEQLRVRSTSRWLAGRMPRQLLNLDPVFRQNREKQVALPAEPSTDMAFIIGVFSGRSGTTKRYRGFEIHSRDPEIVDRLTAAFDKVFQLSGTRSMEEYDGTRYHHFRVGSNQLGRFLEQVTSRNTAVPLRMLPDSQCRRAFLSGFFCACGSSIRPNRRKIHIVKSRNRNLLDEVAVLLKREGVLCAVNGTQRAELLIQDQNDLDRFRELNILLWRPDRLALEKICANRPKRRMFTQEQYNTAMNIMLENPSLKARELSVLIAEQTHGKVVIDKSVLRQWQQGTLPDSIRRAQRLAPIEAAMRRSAAAEDLRKYCVLAIRSLHEPAALLNLFQELAWLDEIAGGAISFASMTLDDYRNRFKRFDIPFTPAHERGWNGAIASVLRAKVAEMADPRLVLKSLQAAGMLGDDIESASLEKLASLKDYQSLLAAHGISLSAVNRAGWGAWERSSEKIAARVGQTRCIHSVLELFAQMPASFDAVCSQNPSQLPSLKCYLAMFRERNVVAGAIHECGWHEAINAQPDRKALRPIARGVHNLILREFDSFDQWAQQTPTMVCDRAARTLDRLAAGEPVLQRDLLELLNLIGVQASSPQMRYLAGLSMAPEPTVLALLATTTPPVRTELARFLAAASRGEKPDDAVLSRLYDLLPGISIESIAQSERQISKSLARPPEPSKSVLINEDVVLDWLDHTPKYRPRLGQLTEIAKKAQYAGLDPQWAVHVIKDSVAKGISSRTSG